jgi:hypothetical protein
MSSDPFTDPPEFRAFKDEARLEFKAWRNDNPRKPYKVMLIEVPLQQVDSE